MQYCCAPPSLNRQPRCITLPAVAPPVLRLRPLCEVVHECILHVITLLDSCALFLYPVLATPPCRMFVVTLAYVVAPDSLLRCSPLRVLHVDLSRRVASVADSAEINAGAPSQVRPG